MNKNLHSLTASRIITAVLLCASVLCIVILPLILKAYFHYRQMPDVLFVPLLIFCYICAPLTAAALYIFYRLLTRISRGQIFEIKNTRLLSLISWICFLIALVTAVATFWYFPCIIIVVAAVFVGLIIRVIQSILVSATMLKDENDMTI